MDKPKIIGTGLSGLVGTRIVELLKDKFEFIDFSLDTGVNLLDKESLDKQILELKENNLINKDVFILSDESVDKGNALIESLNGKLVIGIDDVIGKIKEELL